MLRFLSFLRTGCRALRSAEGGNVALLFGASAIPLLLLMGGSIDLFRYARHKAELTNAVDAAALALARVGQDYTEAQATDYIEEYVAALNVDENQFSVNSIDVDQVSNGFRVSAEASMKTIFLPLGKMADHGKAIMNMEMSIVAEVVSESKRLEVALVLDNSGSMAGSKISTLKTAATDLTEKLYALGANSTLTDPVKVAVVPFAASVNVGSQYASAAWMDTGAKGTYHADTMKAYGAPTTINNFTLFGSLKDSSGNAVTWGGCVEARPTPYDTTDDAPTTASNPSAEQRKTLFVPMFAPDEPDNWTCSTSTCDDAGSSSSSRRYNGAPSGTRSYNNYLPDAGSGTTSGSICGTATSNNATWTCQSGNANCGGSGTGKSEEDAFAGLNHSSNKLCKYGTSTNKATISSITVGGIPGGPNFMCTTPALQPLSTNKATVLAKINGMAAEGATSVGEGTGWGWRVLSPGVPFTEGRAYNDPENKKVLVIMTDGQNTYYPQSHFLKSWYDLYGYVVSGHLGTTSTNATTLRQVMDQRTLQTCTNIKAAEIIIYTVGFDIDSSTADGAAALDVLETCASDPNNFYEASSNADLLAAFSAIGDSISNLHLAK